MPNIHIHIYTHMRTCIHVDNMHVPKHLDLALGWLFVRGLLGKETGDVPEVNVCGEVGGPRLVEHVDLRARN